MRSAGLLLAVTLTASVPADAAPEPAPEAARGEAVEQLPVRMRLMVNELSRARRARRGGAFAAMAGVMLGVAGIGLLERGSTCRTECNGTLALGVLGVIGGIVTLELGAATGLAGSSRERDALLALGARTLGDEGIKAGWGGMAGQVLFPPVGIAVAYGGLAHQGHINRRAMNRLIEDGPTPRAQGRLER